MTKADAFEEKFIFSEHVDISMLSRIVRIVRVRRYNHEIVNIMRNVSSRVESLNISLTQFINVVHLKLRFPIVSNNRLLVHLYAQCFCKHLSWNLNFRKNSAKLTIEKIKYLLKVKEQNNARRNEYAKLT